MPAGSRAEVKVLVTGPVNEIMPSIAGFVIIRPGALRFLSIGIRFESLTECQSVTLHRCRECLEARLEVQDVVRPARV